MPPKQPLDDYNATGTTLVDGAETRWVRGALSVHCDCVQPHTQRRVNSVPSCLPFSHSGTSVEPRLRCTCVGAEFEVTSSSGLRVGFSTALRLKDSSVRCL